MKSVIYLLRAGWVVSTILFFASGIYFVPFLVIRIIVAYIITVETVILTASVLSFVCGVISIQCNDLLLRFDDETMRPVIDRYNKRNNI